MEVRIGIQNSARDVVIETTLSAEEISTAVSEAVKTEGLLTLSDDKGRKVIVPAKGLAYVDIAAAETRKVGFGS